LEIIRYSEELRSVDDYDFPAEGTKEVKISSSEFGMAERLIDELTDKWKPQIFKDTFHDELIKAVKKKKKVEVEEAPETAQEEPVSASKVLDLMPLLEKSISARGKKTSTKTSRRKKAG